MLDISVVMIVNKEDIYNACVENLDTQNDVSYEILKIDNCDGQYTSARCAFNEACKNAKGKYIIFMHPDVRFNEKSSLTNIISYLNAIKDFGVVGVAGCPKELENNKRIILSNIQHGIDRVNAGRNIDKPVEVQTVDECMFAIKNNGKMIFPNKEGWHLYAVELCLKKILEGQKNYVIPANIWHMSDGKSLDYRYILQLKALMNEYKKSFNVINTTVKKWNTSGLKSCIYINYYMLKQYIKGKISLQIKSQAENEEL